VIILSPLIGQASGRLGSLVFVRGPRGGYVRSWVAPTETATTERTAVWNAMQTISPAWAALSDDRKAAWRQFSATHARPNRLGQSHPTGGFQEFFRANAIRSQANHLLGTAFTQVSDPPTTDATCPSVAPQWSLATPFGTLTTILGASGIYSTSAQAAIAIWVSEPQPATRTAYYGAWTLIKAQSKPGLAASFTATVPAGHRPVSGQALFMRCRYWDEYGNLHAPVLGRLIAP
jgi:hypothetical protein